MITVYSKPDCMQCTATKRAFDKRGVTYQAVDVTESPEALAFVKELGYSAMPVVTVNLPDGLDHWSGLRMDQIDAASFLAKAGA